MVAKPAVSVQRNEALEESSRQVRQCLESHNQSQLRKLLGTLHIADLADIFEDLPLVSREQFIKEASDFLDADFLLNVNESYCQQVIEQLGFEHFRASLKTLPNEDIFTLIEAFDEPTQESFLKLLPSVRQKSVRLFLAYPESSVGRYMSVDFLQFSEKDTVQKVREAVRNDPNLPENFSEVFIVNRVHHPVGVVFLKDLLNAPDDAPLTNYMENDILPLSVSASKEEASALFSKYRSVRVPVVSSQGTIVGILRSDNILDVVFDENSERILDVGGMPSDADDSFWRGCWGRLRWIAVTVLNASLSPLVIHAFNDVTEHISSLTSLLPLVASIGGVVGIQSVSVIVKEFAEGNLRAKHFWRPICREVSMGLVNGFIIGIIVGCAAAAWLGEPTVGFVLCLAMFASMTWAAFVGTALPILSARIGFDSSLCSGPIVTTLTDVSGFALFLALAKVILM